MKAIILAAGEGRRLQPLTHSIPKPLLQVGGKSLIERHIERLVAAGISNVIVNLYHLGQEIERVLGSGDKFGAEITYSREDQLMETGGGIAAALGLLGQDDFVVVNGDIYTDFDFGLLNLLPAGVMGHLVLVDNPSHHPEGDFAIEEGGLLARTGACLTYAGISVLSSSLFSGCESAPFPLRDLLLPGAEAGMLTGKHYQGFWSDVGTLQRYEELKVERG